MPTILIVEDHPIIREPMALALRHMGYETLLAADGVEGLAQVSQRVPDLILLDIAMPRMDGISCLRELRRNPATKHVPVIMLTSNADRHKVIEVARLGVAAYLMKGSFALDQLLATVKRALQSSGPGPQISNTVKVAATSQDQGAAAPSHLQSRASSLHRTCEVASIKDLRPLVSKSAVLAAVEKCEELKGFSPAVSEVMSLTASQQCSIGRIAEAISRDHCIALKVLRLANSAIYSRGDQVDTVQKATLRIGIQSIRQALLNLAVIDTFKSSLLDNNQFWEHSIATGLIAVEIARHLGQKELDTPFTLGLLHDVGRLVLAEHMRDSYGQVLDVAHRSQLPLEQVEQRMLGITHAGVMSHLFQRWKFAREFATPVVNHHLPANEIRTAAPHDVVQVATLALADRLAHALMLGSSGNTTIYPTEDLCEMLRLSDSVVGQIVTAARAETDKVKFALLSGSPSASGWQPMIEVYRAKLSQPYCPVCISAHPDMDAVSILARQLQTQRDDPTPNVAILRMRTVKERALLAAQLLDLEKQRGLRTLPLIVLSTSATLTPDPIVLADRWVESLTLPVSMDRFIATANTALSAANPSKRAAA